MHVRNAVRMIRCERWRSTFLVLGLAITLLMAACGQITNRGAVPTAVGGKLTGAGTPVSGVPQVLGPATGGQYESVLTSGGITYLGAGNGLVYAFQSSGGKLLWQRNLISCPMLQYAPPGTLATLARGAAGTLVRMTFTGQMSYDAALDETINLGFRLTNPCYERLPQEARANWTPMGQEHAFAQSHALLVLTTTYNSTAWQQQARSAEGVTQVEVQPDITCATP